MARSPIKHYKLRPHCKSDWPLSIAYYAPFPCYEPRHDHDCYEIMIVTNGSGWCAVGKERHPILPGIMFLIPPGQKHEYQIPLGTLIFNIMFSRDILPEEGRKILLSFPSGAAAQCPPDELDQLQEKLRTADRELTDQRYGYQCLTAAIISEILVVFSRSEWVSSYSSPSGSPDELNTLIDYICRHYREKITLAQLGSLMNWNPAYTGQFFKRTHAGAPIENPRRYPRVESKSWPDVPAPIHVGDVFGWRSDVPMRWLCRTGTGHSRRDQ